MSGCIEVMRDELPLKVNSKWTTMSKEQREKLHMKQEVARQEVLDRGEQKTTAAGTKAWLKKNIGTTKKRERVTLQV